MSDIASLIIRVTTTGVASAGRDLDTMTKAARVATVAVGSLATAAGGAGAYLVSAQRKVDVMQASLITMTGSAENASKAFAILQQFAKDTPYGLQQAVDGFTKLTALGLEPSIEALTSYGNTAAAMGKDLNQMIEAVADASTGEFERLKEFGIKASQEGNKVSFTFNGVTTTIGKNAKEIQGYLLDLGNTKFSGAMEERAKTLDGAISSLGDTWDGLMITLSKETGVSTAGDSVRYLEDAIQNLNDSVASGEFKVLFDAAIWNDLTNGAKESSNWFLQLADDVEELSQKWGLSNTAIDEGKTVTENLMMSFATLKDGIYDAWMQYSDFIDDLVRGSAQAGDRIRNALSGGDAIKASIARAKVEDQAVQALRDQREISRQTAEEQMAAAIKLAAEKRKQYSEQQEAIRKQKLQDLVKPGGGSSDDGSSSAAADKSAKAAAKLAEQQKRQAQDFLDTLARQNQDELAAIDAQEQQKLEKLQKFNEMGRIIGQQYEDAKTQIALDADAKRNELLQKQTEEWAKNQNDADSFLEQLRAQNDGELAEIDRQNDEKIKKLDELHAKGRVKEKEYQEALKNIQQDTEKKKSDVYRGALGDMTDNLRTALGENSALYKAAAITQTIIETYKGAQAAFSALAPIPIVGPALGGAAAAAAIAAGLARVGQIRSAREQGGNLAAGQISTIAERGKPEVIMPAGASRVRTAEQMRQIMGEGKSNGTPQISIINQTTGRIDSVQQEQDDEGRITLLIREVVSGDLQDSNSRITKSRRVTRGQPGFS